jgi:alcohol dehydrogenase, propanol-preferring
MTGAPFIWSRRLLTMNTPFAAPKGTMILGADPLRFAQQNLTLKGTLVGSRGDITKALDYARRGKLQQIYTVYPIDKLPEAVEKIRKGETVGRSVVDFNL